MTLDLSTRVRPVSRSVNLRQKNSSANRSCWARNESWTKRQIHHRVQIVAMAKVDSRNSIFAVLPKPIAVASTQSSRTNPYKQLDLAKLVALFKTHPDAVLLRLVSSCFVCRVVANPLVHINGSACHVLRHPTESSSQDHDVYHRDTPLPLLLQGIQDHHPMRSKAPRLAPEVFPKQVQRDHRTVPEVQSLWPLPQMLHRRPVPVCSTAETEAEAQWEKQPQIHLTHLVLVAHSRLARASPRRLRVERARGWQVQVRKDCAQACGDGVIRCTSSR